MSGIETLSRRTIARQEVGDILADRREGLVAIIGQCAATADNLHITNREGAALQSLEASTRNLGQTALTVIHRMPPWKPRSNPEDWHGLETTDLDMALELLHGQARLGDKVAMELAKPEHVDRYADALTLGWTGSRNSEEQGLLIDIALRSGNLPIAIKNGMDGDPRSAQELAQKINQRRADMGIDAPAVVIYRGGTLAQTPAAWERQYLEAMEMTEGQLILDVAHGTEMAHDPMGKFQKSAKAEEIALEHATELIADGIVPKGIMLEASDATTTTDPHMPFRVAVDGVKRIHQLINR